MPGNDEKGCQHYNRNCLIIAECCNKAYKCHFCHDDQEKHKINRYEIKYMVCLFCNTQQPAQMNCINCKNIMADYYCDICKLWTDSTEKVFHCQSCKLCRVGNENKFFHCDFCDACMDIRLKGNHTHIENSLKSDCPICAEYMFTSIKEVAMLTCGHAMHTECFDHYNLTHYQCPICTKIAGDAAEFNKKVDYMLQRTEKFENVNIKPLSEISCYDCGGISKVKLRHMYNRCLKCQSYNTRVKDQINEFTENYRDS